MLSNRLTSLAIASLLLAPLPVLAATPGAVQAEQSPTMPAPGGHFMGKGHGGKLGGLFTPEQRAMLQLQLRDQSKDMSREQRQALRKDQVKKLLAMSEGDRQTFKSDLQARWDALPPAQKDRFEQRISQRAQNGR